MAAGPISNSRGDYAGLRRHHSIAAALRDREGPLRVIFDNIQDVVYLLAVEDEGRYRFVAVNPPFLSATGLTEDQVVGRLVEEVIPEPSLSLVRARYDHAIQSGKPVFWEESTEFPAGTRHGEVMVAPVQDGEGRTVQLVGTVHDVTEHRRAEEQLHRLAHYDTLTDLPNRHHLHDALARELAAASAQGHAIAVLYLDLDGFKEVNDTHGHLLGDQLLHQVGDRLLESTRHRDVVGRFGGDEFVIVAPLGVQRDDAAALAMNIIDALQRPFHVDGLDVQVTTSIGIALCPDDAADPETLIRAADTAMYYAKGDGRNGFRFFTEEMNAWLRERRELEAALRRAVEREEFALHYQPKVELASGRWCGAEALLRWQRPGRGWVDPDIFVPVLEETGLILPVGRWVVAAACRQLASWRDAGLEWLPVSINVSGRQVLADQRRHSRQEAGECGTDVATGFCEFVKDTIAQYHIEAGQLDIELTESTLMRDADRAIELLDCLAEMGVHVQVDDFGTGYSSLAYLRRFPIRALKVDKAFVRGIPGDEEDCAVTRAIITLAHALDLVVVAEGVERDDQIAFLAGEACDQAQGFHFARPLAADAFAAAYRAQRGASGDPPARSVP